MHYLNRTIIYRSPILQLYKRTTIIRQLNGSNGEEPSLKKLKLLKKLASTILFGGTFLTVLYAKKKKRSPLPEDMKMVKNPNFGNNNFKLYEYQGFVLPSFVATNFMKIQDFHCREDDIFVSSFPKTGTTWLQEIIYCVVKGVENSQSKSIEDRFPYLEFLYPGLASIEKVNEQRFIKTHLPFSLLPKEIDTKKPKIFCIVRNPKDVAVSYYHFVRMMTISDYNGSFSDFFEDFISNKVPYGPLWKHYQDMWYHRNDQNVFIISYEELHKDIRKCIKNIAEHLDRNISEQEIDAIAEHCSFEKMSKNPNVNYDHWDDLGIRKKGEVKFMRKGIIGDWKNYFTLEMTKAMDSWIDENMTEIVLKFSYKEC